jgi:hypothetical protein
MKEDGDVNLYAMVDNDPVIFFDFEGLRRSQSYDQYWTEWKAKHTGLTEAQYAWAKNILALGCIGITEINLGQYDPHTGVPSTSNCWKGKAQADAEQQRMKGGCSCGAKGNPKLFSIHLWNSSNGLDGKTPSVSFDNSGKANMGNWDSRTGGRTLFGITMVNFDFGWVEDDGSITHADMYHNPDRKFFPDLDPRVMTVFNDNLNDWQEVGRGGLFSPYNTEVWCVACDGGKYGQ